MKLPPKQTRLWTFLRRNPRTCLAKSKERAYKALVRPIVEYSADVCDPCVAKNIQQVEMIQSYSTPSSSLGTRALRQIRQCHWYVIYSQMEISGALAISRTSLLYKQCNGLATYDCDKLQREHKSRMDTRLSSLSHRFEQLRCTCDYYKNAIYPRSAQWNNLSPEIIASTLPCSFRQSLCNLTYWLVILCYCFIHCRNFYYLKQSAILK